MASHCAGAQQEDPKQEAAEHGSETNSDTPQAKRRQPQGRSSEDGGNHRGDH